MSHCSFVWPDRLRPKLAAKIDTNTQMRDCLFQTNVRFTAKPCLTVYLHCFASLPCYEAHLRVQLTHVINCLISRDKCIYILHTFVQRIIFCILLYKRHIFLRNIQIYTSTNTNIQGLEFHIFLYTNIQIYLLKCKNIQALDFSIIVVYNLYKNTYKYTYTKKYIKFVVKLASLPNTDSPISFN